MIRSCKQRLPLPELLVRLRLFDRPPKSGSHPCPLHSEQHGAAFALTFKRDSWVWKCHGKCAAGGDEVTLLQTYFNLSLAGAIRRYEELCEIVPQASLGNIARTIRSAAPQFIPEKHMPIEPPPDLHKGSYEECAAVAQLRKVPVETILAMSKAGHIAFATVHDCESFIVLDSTRLLAEARCITGAQFPARGTLAERKTHTLKGSHKNWPLGLAGGAGPILLVEGSGDFIAAHYFCSFSHRTHAPWIPVAILGASVKNLHPDAAALFSGRHVRIVPHLDAAGKNAACHWAKTLRHLNCTVDGFDLSALSQTNGEPVTDLNDATGLDTTQSAELTQLFRLVPATTASL
jgi:hypothetical protein